ncbi:MAG: hypothetical protein NXI31_16855 [bacterium]|nr:hypothetical protein [bacterium]
MATLRTLGLATVTAALAGACATPPGVLVFASARSGAGDLYAEAKAGGELRRLVATPAAEGNPRYDAHSARLVHYRFGDDDAAVLYSGADRLGDDPAGGAAPAWCPTRPRIAFARSADGREDLWLMDWPAGTPRRVTDDPALDRYPSWSPDGERLVFARKAARGDGGWDLWTLAVDDPAAQPEQLTHDGVYVGHPSWSPCGRWIAFDRQNGEETDIARLDLRTDRLEFVCRRPGNDLVPAWSLDGRRLAFGGVDPATGDWDLYELSLSGFYLRRVTSAAGFDGAPAYVPAGLIASPPTPHQR